MFNSIVLCLIQKNEYQSLYFIQYHCLSTDIRQGQNCLPKICWCKNVPFFKNVVVHHIFHIGNQLSGFCGHILFCLLWGCVWLLWCKMSLTKLPANYVHRLATYLMSNIQRVNFCLFVPIYVNCYSQWPCLANEWLHICPHPFFWS